MFRSRLRPWWTPGVLALGVAVLLATAPVAFAGGPPYGIPSGVMPWEYYKYYKGYKKPPHGYGQRPAPPRTVSQAPKKYMVQVARVPYKHTADDANVVVVMAHVPEDASIWFDDTPTQQKGELRYFESPPIKPGRSYSYSVRTVWYEDGEWVTQTVSVPVKAGEVRCVYIVQADQAKELAEITANLEKLTPEDQALATQQRVCAVQTDKQLGSMGVPVKVTVKGRPVFLCCEGCVKKALGNPDQTLERLQKVKPKDDPGVSP